MALADMLQKKQEELAKPNLRTILPPGGAPRNMAAAIGPAGTPGNPTAAQMLATGKETLRGAGTAVGGVLAAPFTDTRNTGYDVPSQAPPLITGEWLKKQFTSDAPSIYGRGSEPSPQTPAAVAPAPAAVLTPEARRAQTMPITTTKAPNIGSYNTTETVYNTPAEGEAPTDYGKNVSIIKFADNAPEVVVDKGPAPRTEAQIFKDLSYGNTTWDMPVEQRAALAQRQFAAQQDTSKATTAAEATKASEATRLKGTLASAEAELKGKEISAKSVLGAAGLNAEAQKYTADKSFEAAKSRMQTLLEQSKKTTVTEGDYGKQVEVAAKILEGYNALGRVLTPAEIQDKKDLEEMIKVRLPKISKSRTAYNPYTAAE